MRGEESSVGRRSGYREQMDVPAHRDEGRALGALTPVDGAAPIAIIDFLANAESVLHRLGAHTCVADWVMARLLGTEWIVLAGEGGHGLRPGAVLDRPPGASRHPEIGRAQGWTPVTNAPRVCR